MRTDYKDIINKCRPEPTHPRMSVSDRAKIFSPFAALRGHDKAIAAQRLRRVDRIVLSEEEQASVNEALCALKRHDAVSVTHFVTDPGTDGSGGYAEGEYMVTVGELEEIDVAYKIIKINDEKIRFDDILEVSRTDGQRQPHFSRRNAMYFS